jgi:hypothetical protein
MDAGVQAVLEEVLLSPDFGGEKPGWGIRFRQQRDNDLELPDIPWTTEIAEFFAWVLRFFLVCGLLVLGGFLFFRLKRIRRGQSPGPDYRSFGILPGKTESPESLLEKARAFYREGKIREAWACCFSGAIAAFSWYRGLAFPPDATEYDCLALVPVSPGFTALVARWVGFAYGGKIPPEGAFEAALDFSRSLLNPQADISAPGKNHG